jgi:C1A family cysteine protease
MHSPLRLAAPAKGKLTLRNPAQRYKATGFVARPSKTKVAGAAGLPLRTLKSPNKMPDNFCYTPSELTQVRDQKACGCCWAVSSTTMVADRVLVASKYKIRCALSAVQYMECSGYLEESPPVGCEGNDVFVALQSLKNKPIYLVPEEKYARTDYTQTTTATNCITGEPTGYCVTASDAFMITKEIPDDADETEKAKLIAENIENMKQSIYNEGPIVVNFFVPKDFSDYDGNTIYQSPENFDPNNPDMCTGMHAVEMVGWGKDESSGHMYWVCRNSWGDKWPVVHKKCNGMGFFYMTMGKNDCNIEALASAVTVKIINPDKAPKNSPNDSYPGEGACTKGRGFLGSPMLGPITWGEFIAFAAVAGAGYYLWYNHKKTGRWVPDYIQKLIS